MDTQLIYSLVHSLTEEEAQRCLASFKGQEKKLFQLLLSFPTYEFHNIQLKIGAAEIAPKVSNQLLQAILKSEDRNVANLEDQAKALYKKSVWLYKKRLFSLCITLLDQAKTLATKFDMLELLLNIATLEFNLHQVGAIRSQNSPIDNYVFYADSVYNYHRYNAIKFKLYSIGLMVEDPESMRVRYFLHNELLQSETLALSIKAKLLFYEIKAKVHFIIEDFEAAYHYLQQLFALYEEHPHFLQIRSVASSYISNIASYVRLGEKLHKNIDTFATMKWFRNLSETYGFIEDNSLALQLHTLSYSEEVQTYYQATEFDKIIGLIPEVTQFFKNTNFNYNTAHKYTIYFYFAKTLFVNEFYDEALIWLNHILSNWQNVAGEDLKAEVLQMKMLTFIELEKYEALGELVVETEHFFKLTKRRSQYEMLVLELMKNIARHPFDEGKLNDLYKNYQVYLTAVLEEVAKNQKRTSFEVVAWLESKLRKQPLMTILEENAQKMIS